MNKILVVDDEPAMREGLADNLLFEGYQVDMAEDGKVALKKIAEQSYDLLILDVMMPEISGFDVCKKLRMEGHKLPVILLTAKGEEIDRVLGLELGADDYITKPFSLRELLARVKAVLRRTQDSHSSSPQQFETIGLMEVDFKNFIAKKDHQEIKLSHREFEVLKFLKNHQQEIVSRDELLKNIWKYDEFPTTRTVDNFILRLRQKIEINPNEPKIILTVHGMGYKMVGF
ncbi:two-component system, OmpR family, response regulator VicR [Reichenbachiella faecimaris]|uniref:Two-component system, OmpR family, response regulator VicR n=1 Tax=Reichenbachiella faecimaris TaxID=692418 RepID=A0A1W2GB24_REIFA|nr:response regulator transcription factor [Reichenbachiella faecimaris]SMD33865.1 two-component system, OmpR family, response regulator VicR [Reichenbachiella faecimaris]